MYLGADPDEEHRLTLEMTVELANAHHDQEQDVRSVLVEHGFSRAPSAAAAAVARVEHGIAELGSLFAALADDDLVAAVRLVNEALTEVALAPSLTTHDDTPLHLHWTAPTAPFDQQVLADVLVALAHELEADGTSRFGRCAAEDCGRWFHDATRNRSRRFCSDPRCASRTHTARHRARRRTGDIGPRAK